MHALLKRTKTTVKDIFEKKVFKKIPFCKPWFYSPFISADFSAKLKFAIESYTYTWGHYWIWSTVFYFSFFFFLFSFEPLLCYTTYILSKATHFFSRCFSIANRQNEEKSKKKKICFELHPRATLFNCLSATLQWGHSRNYCPAKRMFICSKTAQARRDRERQFWEKKFSVANFSQLIETFSILEKMQVKSWESSLGFLNNWIYIKDYRCKHSWQHWKRRKKRNRKTWMRCCIDRCLKKNQ